MSPSTFRVLSIIFLVISIAFWLAVSYPARLSADSLDLLNTIKLGTISNSHTLAYYFFIKVTSLNSQFIIGSSIAQSILVVFAIRELLTLVFKTNTGLINILSGITFLTPMIGAMSVTLWKDIPFAALMLIGIIKLIKSKSTEKLSSFPFLVLLVGSQFRHDGWLTIFVMTLLFWVFSLFRSIKPQPRLIGRLIITLVISFLIMTFLPKIASDQEVRPWIRTSTLLHDLQYVNNTHPGLVAAEDAAILNIIATGPSRDGSRFCSNLNPLVYSEGFNQDFADKYSDRIIPMWLNQLFSTSFDELIAAHYCRVKAFLPPPFSQGPGYVYWIHPGIDQPNPIGVKDIPHMGVLTAAANTSIKWLAINNAMFIWPGFISMVFLLLMIGKSPLRMQPIARVILVSLVLGRITTLSAVAPAQDFRYAFLIYLIGIPLIFAAILIKLTKGRFKY